MKQGPAAVAAIILETFELDTPPVDITSSICKIITERGWETESVAYEKAEKWKAAVLARLRNELNSLQKLGRPARITFNSSSNYLLQGACFIEPSDSHELRDSKGRRLESTNYYQLLSKLTPSQFESLSGKLIELLGVQNPTVTRRSADEGIDFYGRLALDSIFFPQDLTPTIQKQLSIWLVGQSKRYIDTQFGTSEIRDLVGAVALGRAQIYGSIKSPFPDLKIRVGDPVFAVLLTTGRISANAWRLLERSGVIGMDREMLAAFLADRSAGQLSGYFDEKDFFKWIQIGS